jgi:hypothetical protein
MRSASPGEQVEIHQHSGWLIPLGIGLALVALCVVVLLYDLRPAALFRGAQPSADASIVRLALKGSHFGIPGNYLDTRGAHGDVTAVAFSALLPDMRGFSAPDAGLFLSNAPDSQVVHLLLRADEDGLSTSDRLTRVYKPYVTGPDGTPDAFGLVRYNFRDGSGYERNDLYAGGQDATLLLLLCERPAQDLPSPNCLAIDRPVASGVSLSYRFKRSQLSQWRQIAAGVDQLITRFKRES